MTSNTKFEIEAHAFYSVTGLMAPGKDWPPGAGPDDYEKRQVAWREWRANHGVVILAMLKAFEYMENL